MITWDIVELLNHLVMFHTICVMLTTQKDLNIMHVVKIVGLQAAETKPWVIPIN